jgi:hypothetical protein
MLATTSVQIDEITCSAKKSSDVLYDLVLNAAPPRPGWPCAEIALGA